jgi:septal ring factor EnvC (AmiA/AmiB activator)
VNEGVLLLQAMRRERKEARDERRKELQAELERTRLKIDQLRVEEELLERQLEDLESGEDLDDDLYEWLLSGDLQFDAFSGGETA